jgi:pyruvate/2-oxoglutarate dehydrogenase complex dihydrolipoamide dehydrogenase (E3) component
MRKDNIDLFLNSETIRIEEIEGSKIVHVQDDQKNTTKINCDEVLIATGRVANVEELGLDTVGVKYDSRGVFINNSCQTNISNIYAVGDVARGQQFTHFANHQAKIAIANIIFKLPFNYEKRVVPRVTYTQPEIASVGLDFSDDSNEVVAGKVLILNKSFDEIDRAITDNSKEGFFKIFVDRKGYILGACLVGNNVGELIGEIALAMKNKIKITNLADTIHPYPTYSYGLRNCADQFRSHNFSANKKNWLKKIFNLKGK